jgi:hypothetical protein
MGSLGIELHRSVTRDVRLLGRAQRAYRSQGLWNLPRFARRMSFLDAIVNERLWTSNYITCAYGVSPSESRRY